MPIVEFIHEVTEPEARDLYLNLKSVTGKRYGDDFPEGGTKYVVYDQDGRRFNAKQHHNTQLWRGGLNEWFRTNHVSVGDRVRIRYNSESQSPDGNPVIELAVLSDADRPDSSGRVDSGSQSQVSADQLRENLERQDEIGDAGEAIAYRFELQRLSDLGYTDAEQHLDHIAQNDVSAGYDIHSSPPEHDQRFIEVKSSTVDERSFYISRNELEVLRDLESKAFLYVVRVADPLHEEGYVVEQIPDPVGRFESAETFEPVLFQVTL